MMVTGGGGCDSGAVCCGVKRAIAFYCIRKNLDSGNTSENISLHTLTL